MTDQNEARCVGCATGPRDLSLSKRDARTNNPTQFELQWPIDAAIAWCGRGFAVFPIRPRTRIPFTRHGFKDASGDLEIIRQWWTRWPKASIGVATGRGIFVLDIDGPAGEVALVAFCAQHGPLPDTLTQKTSRGRHLFFTSSADVPCRPKGQIGPDLEIKGRSGCVTVAPSIHPDGTIYRITNDVPIAEAPDWLVKLAIPPKVEPFVRRERFDLPAGDPIDVRTLARALGGKVSNGQALVPGPGHSAIDRSLVVKPVPNGDGFVVNSFAGDDPIECKDYIRRALGLPQWQPRRRS